MTEIEKLLIYLIKIPSVSGEEKRIGDFIIGQLKGFKIKKQKISDKRFNIVAKKGNSSKWLVAHMDTVPGTVPIKINKDRIFGRGACDNKQSIAASIIIGNKLENINLLFTVGEEDNFIGAKKAKQQGIKGSLVIVQEPTKFKIMTAQKGVIGFKVKTKGIKKHSSIEKIDSANHRLIKILSDLMKKNWSCYNVGAMSGGTFSNIVAGDASALVSVRPKNIKEYDEVLKCLKNHPAEILIEAAYPPYKSRLDFPENESKFFTEMIFFKNSIQFGAGDIKFAHTENENIKRKDLNILPKKLLNLLK